MCKPVTNFLTVKPTAQAQAYCEQACKDQAVHEEVNQAAQDQAEKDQIDADAELIESLGDFVCY